MLSRVVLIATQSLAHVRIFFLLKFHQFSTIWQYFLVVYFIIINFLTHLPFQLLFFLDQKVEPVCGRSVSEGDPRKTIKAHNEALENSR